MCRRRGSVSWRSLVTFLPMRCAIAHVLDARTLQLVKLARVVGKDGELGAVPAYTTVKT